MFRTPSGPVLLGLLLLFLAAPLPAVAQVGATPQAQLKPLGFLIGTWTGNGRLEDVGAYTAEYTFSWVMNRAFIQHTRTMKVKDKVLWRDMGLIGWDPEQKKLVNFTFGLDGSIGRGTAIESGKPDTLVFEGSTVGVRPLHGWRSTLSVVNEDQLNTLLELRNGDKYTQLMTVRYTRVKPPEPPPLDEGHARRPVQRSRT